jgi:hypothetical protein
LSVLVTHEQKRSHWEALCSVCRVVVIGFMIAGYWIGMIKSKLSLPCLSQYLHLFTKARG